MQFKVIDSKMKEIYFSPVKIDDKEETAEFNNTFWNTMNVIAYQNMALQQVRFA